MTIFLAKIFGTKIIGKIDFQQNLKLTPEQKLTQSLRLYYNAKELKAAALRKFHPEMNEVQIKEKVEEIFLYAKS
jgi:hypothetical protein